MTLPPDPTLQAQRLLARRAHLPAQGTTVYRAAHLTETDHVYALDLAGDTGILSLYRDLSAAQEHALARAWADAATLRAVYVKRRPQEARHAANVDRDRLAPPRPLWGEDTPEVTALEDGVPYLIRPGGDLSVGLFTDARPARRWVRTHATGRVLNTFAYTCAFGLNATLAGADTVKNLDLSRKVLEWGQQNYALSGQPHPDRDFIYGDVFDWLHRLARKDDRYDLVILDPPSFARSRSGVWRSERDYANLAALAAALLAPHGHLLAMNNHAGVTHATFERMLHAGAPHLKVTERLGPGEDYPAATHLKVVTLQAN